MEELSQDPRVLSNCKSCGGDPGGVVFEGLILTGMLTADDIVALLRGAKNRRAINRLFVDRILHGTKLGGRNWLIRSSQFVTDWEHHERREVPIRAARPTTVEVARRAR